MSAASRGQAPSNEPEIRCPICDLRASASLRATISSFLRERCDLPSRVEAQSHLCEACEHVFLTPFLSRMELRRLYAGYRGADYNTTRLRLEPDYANHMSAFADVQSAHFTARRAFYDEFHADRFGAKGIVVDAGDGEGYFGRYAYPFADVVTLSRTEPTPGVVLTELMGAADVLFIAHVLQQTSRPVAVLSRLTRRMRPGAEVWIEVPVQYFGSLKGAFGSLALLARRGTCPPDPLATLHENLAHFSVRSLRRLCERTGLIPVEVVRSGIGVAAILATRSGDQLDQPFGCDDDERTSSVIA